MEIADNFFLQPGYIYTSKTPCQISTVLGSCVSVCLWDSMNCLGGMNHYILSIDKYNERSCKYGDVSVTYLIRLMLQMGCRAEDLHASIIGGGWHPKLTPVVGEENVSVAEQILKRYEIAVVKKEIGGQFSRRVIFDVKNGDVHVSRNAGMKGGD